MAAGCDAQIVAYSFIYSLGSAALAFGGLPVGILLDLPSFGPPACAALGGTLVGGGLLAIAFLPVDAFGGDAFIPPFVGLGFGGQMAFFTAMKVAAIFPEHKAPLLIGASCAMHTSAIVPLLFYELMEHFGLPRALVIGVFGAFVLAIFTAWALLWRTFAQFLPAPAGASPAKPIDTHGAVPPPAAPKREYGIPIIPPHLTIMEALRSEQLCAACRAHQFRFPPLPNALPHVPLPFKFPRPLFTFLSPTVPVSAQRGGMRLVRHSPVARQHLPRGSQVHARRTR